jgi:hypothetical protein
MDNEPLELYINVPWTQFMTPVMHWGAEPTSGQLSKRGREAAGAYHCPSSGIVRSHSTRFQY